LRHEVDAVKWATRPGIHIDRAASAWLIVRRIDPGAEFVYCTDLTDVPGDATAFDMFGADLGHHGDDVTFETILRRYDLDDPVLWRIAEIVHEADIEDGRFDAPAAPGFDLLFRAMQHGQADEDVRLVTSQVLDQVELYLRDEMLRGL